MHRTRLVGGGVAAGTHRHQQARRALTVSVSPVNLRQLRAALRAVESRVEPLLPDASANKRLQKKVAANICRRRKAGHGGNAVRGAGCCWPRVAASAGVRVSQFMGDESILHSNDNRIATTRSRAVFSTACVFTSSTVRAQCVRRGQPWQ
jgi:hypothetical protein